jgi:hypothetical protein
MRIGRKGFLLGGAAALGMFAVGGAAYAQTATPTPGARPNPAAKHEAMLAAIAAKLGKSVDELKAAMAAVHKDQLDAAVAAGRLTREQADRMLERMQNGPGLGFPGPIGRGVGPGFKGGPHGPGGMGPGRGAGPLAVPGLASAADLATFLGIAPNELAEALRSGKSLAAIAQEKGKTRDQLKTFLTDGVKKRLDEAVAAGRLTRAQADEMLARHTANLDTAIDRVRPAPGEKPARPERPRARRPGEPGEPRSGVEGRGPGAGIRA